MREEELNKEAEEHCNEVLCSVCEKVTCTKKIKCREWRDRRAGYYCGAEPREKQIADLEQKNKDLADCNSRLLSQAAAATKRVIQQEKENADLKTEKQYWEQKANRLTTEWGETLDQLAQAKKIIMNLRNIITGDITIIDTEEKGSFFKQAVEFLKEEI